MKNLCPDPGRWRDVLIGFEFRTAAKPKRGSDDAPNQEPMRAGIKPANRKAPTTDQKKVRRQMSKNAAYRDEPEVQAWYKSRENVTYTDGTPVKEGDHIRFHQAPGGLMAHGDWEYGVASYLPASWNSMAAHELHLLDDQGRYFILYGHVIERADKPTSTASKENPMSGQREVEILQAMAKATGSEQRRLAAELEGIRSSRTASVHEAREVDLADAIVRDTLTPVRVHEHHTAATDWITEMPTSSEGAYDHAMRTEATLWFDRVHVAVKEDREEFTEQAKGMARRHAGKYGEEAGEAAQVFMDTVARLHRMADSSPSAQNGNAESTITDYDTQMGQEPYLGDDWDGDDTSGATGVHPPMPGAGETVTATALWEKAKENESQLIHSDSLTPDGQSWVRSLGSKTAGVSGLVIEEEWDLPAMLPSERGVIARINDKMIGGLLWDPATGIIQYIQVDADQRRKGIATLLLQAARRIDPNVRHDIESNHSELGKEWVKAVGSKHQRFPDDTHSGAGIWTARWRTAAQRTAAGDANGDVSDCQFEYDGDKWYTGTANGGNCEVCKGALIPATLNMSSVEAYVTAYNPSGQKAIHRGCGNDIQRSGSRRTSSDSQPRTESHCLECGGDVYWDGARWLHSSTDQDHDVMVPTQHMREGSRRTAGEYKSDAVKTSSRRTASLGSRTRTSSGDNTCSVCGDKIAKDPASESPSTWHHDNGEKHDHEAKPGSSTTSSRRTAADTADEFYLTTGRQGYGGKIISGPHTYDEAKAKAKATDGPVSIMQGTHPLLPKASARKTAISLTNVGIEDGNGVGTDPSGNRIKFTLSAKDLADLKAVLYSDMAMNFSGVDIEQSDIIKDSRRHTAGEVPEAFKKNWKKGDGDGDGEEGEGKPWLNDDGTKKKDASRKTAGDSVNVISLPECDIHKYQRGQSGVLAAYDGKTSMGPWANMCEECFSQFGVGLGTGRGQRLVVAASRRTALSGTAVVGYTADADIFCVDCAHRIYGDDNLGANPVQDGEGNEVSPVFGSDDFEGEVCGSCGRELGSGTTASRRVAWQGTSEDRDGVADYKSGKQKWESGDPLVCNSDDCDKASTSGKPGDVCPTCGDGRLVWGTPRSQSKQSSRRVANEGPTWAKDCQVCGQTVERWRGEGDVSCVCGAQYNAAGQRLRNDWASNPSNYDDEIGDMEGYEMQHGREYSLRVANVWGQNQRHADAQNGNAESGLPQVEVNSNTDVMWPVELDENGDPKVNQGAAKGGTPTPGGPSGYPQPTASVIPAQGRTADFRARVQAGLARMTSDEVDMGKFVQDRIAQA